MLERAIYSFLLEWRNSEHKGVNRKPLVVRGARQVGKTEVVRQFGRQEFDNTIELNFERNPQLESLFESSEIGSIVKFLEIETAQSICPGQTLLFLDEIQAAPRVLAKLRYFYEDFPELHIIAAGSLLEFALADLSYSMPVGRIDYLYLGPLNFEEFLAAVGEHKLLEFIVTYEIGVKIPLAIHERLLKRFREYSIIGGMPEAVAAYCLTSNLEKCEQVKQSILSTYRDDFSKYAPKAQLDLLQRIYTKVPRFVGQRIKYSKLDADAKAADVNRALNLLATAQVIHRIYHSSSNGVPLEAEVNPKIFKLLFLDVGLVNTAMGLNLLDVEQSNSLLQVNNGSVAEQVVGQQLLYSGRPYEPPSLHFWQREKKGASAEVDYVIARGGKILPLEIKAGKTGKLRSLQQFLYEKKLTFGVKLDSNLPTNTQSGIESGSVQLTTGETVHFDLASLPLYFAGQLWRLVDGV